VPLLTFLAAHALPVAPRVPLSCQASQAPPCWPCVPSFLCHLNRLTPRFAAPGRRFPMPDVRRHGGPWLFVPVCAGAGLFTACGFLPPLRPPLRARLLWSPPLLYLLFRASRRRVPTASLLGAGRARCDSLLNPSTALRRYRPVSLFRSVCVAGWFGCLACAVFASPRPVRSVARELRARFLPILLRLLGTPGVLFTAFGLAHRQRLVRSFLLCRGQSLLLCPWAFTQGPYMSLPCLFGAFLRVALVAPRYPALASPCGAARGLPVASLSAHLLGSSCPGTPSAPWRAGPCAPAAAPFGLRLLRGGARHSARSASALLACWVPAFSPVGAAWGRCHPRSAFRIVARRV